MGPPLEIKLNMPFSPTKNRSQKGNRIDNSSNPSLSPPSKTTVKHAQAGLLALPIPSFAFPPRSSGTVTRIPEPRLAQGTGLFPSVMESGRDGITAAGPRRILTVFPLRFLEEPPEHDLLFFNKSCQTYPRHGRMIVPPRGRSVTRLTQLLHVQHRFHPGLLPHTLLHESSNPRTHQGRSQQESTAP